MRALAVRPLRPTDWPALEALFGARGACGHCWCMAWRYAETERWSAGKRDGGNQRAFARLVRGGRATGVLALSGGRAVGWCSVGPRADFARLERMRSLRTDWDASTWSVTCLFVARDWRERGVGSALVAGAVALARSAGARALEAYPAVPTRGFGRGGRMPGPFLWTGVPQLYARQRFRPLARTPAKRPIYVRRFTPTRTSRA